MQATLSAANRAPEILQHASHENPVLLAELTVRHTRRHMPTRRVAIDHAYLPTSGGGHGISLGRDGRRRPPPARTRGAARAAASAARPSAQRSHASRASRCGTGSSTTSTASTGRAIASSVRTGTSSSSSTGTARRRRRCSARSWPRPRSRDRAGVRCSTRSARVVNGRWAGLAADVELRELFDRESTMPPPLAGTRRGHRARPRKRRRGAASPRRSGGPWRCSACGSG